MDRKILYFNIYRVNMMYKYGHKQKRYEMKYQVEQYWKNLQHNFYAEQSKTGIFSKKL